MRNYAKWLIYYNLSLLSAIVNWVAAFFGFGGLVEWESTFLVKITEKNYEAELERMRQRADEAKYEAERILALEKKNHLYIDEDDDHGHE
jgi:preprotein translocase subunit SecF